MEPDEDNVIGGSDHNQVDAEMQEDAETQSNFDHDDFKTGSGFDQEASTGERDAPESTDDSESEVESEDEISDDVAPLLGMYNCTVCTMNNGEMQALFFTAVVSGL